MTFGEPFTRALLLGCGSIRVPPRDVLRTLALESGINPFARNARSRARGMWQCMPRGAVEYTVTDPVRQINDAFAFWRAFMTQHHIATFKSGNEFYCLNLAPARLIGGLCDESTIIYSTNPEDQPLNAQGDRFSRTYWPTAYRDNAAPFGLDPKDPRGRLRMRDLSAGLDAAVKRCQARFGAELAEAVRLDGPTPATWHGTADQPDIRDPALREPDAG